MAISMTTIRIYCCAVLIIVAGCDVQRPEKSQGPGPPAGQYFQRFVPVPETGTIGLLYGVPRPFVALDTVTGKLCRTWNFSWPSPSDVQRVIQELPVCADLYEIDKVIATEPKAEVPK